MRITLSGDLGSGKSSVGKQLASRLGIPHHSAGSLFREIGQISNLDALRTNLAAEDNVEIDHKVDQRTREIDQTVERFIIDSRMAWHFVSNAIKVYLSVSPETAAVRVMSDTTRASESYDSLAAAIAALSNRRQSETKRYKKLYDVDIADIANYDLFIITDDAAVEAITDVILAYAEGKTRAKFWMPKTRLVPMIEAQPGNDGAGPVTRLSDDFRLPVAVADNFGFFGGDAASVEAAFRFELPLVPYEEQATSATGPGNDIIEHASRQLTRSGLARWEERYGVKLAFADQLRPHATA